MTNKDTILRQQFVLGGHARAVAVIIASLRSFGEFDALRILRAVGAFYGFTVERK